MNGFPDKSNKKIMSPSPHHKMEVHTMNAVFGGPIVVPTKNGKRNGAAKKEQKQQQQSPKHKTAAGNRVKSNNNVVVLPKRNGTSNGGGAGSEAQTSDSEGTSLPAEDEGAAKAGDATTSAETSGGDTATTSNGTTTDESDKADADSGCSSSELKNDAESSGNETSGNETSGDAETSSAEVSSSAAAAHEAKSDDEGAQTTNGATSTTVDDKYESDATQTSEGVSTDNNNNNNKTKNAASTDNSDGKSKASGAATTGPWLLTDDVLLRSLKEGGETWAVIAKVVGRGKKEAQRRWKELCAGDTAVPRTTKVVVVADTSGEEADNEAEAEASEGVVKGGSNGKGNKNGNGKGDGNKNGNGKWDGNKNGKKTKKNKSSNGKGDSKEEAKTKPKGNGKGVTIQPLASSPLSQPSSSSAATSPQSTATESAAERAAQKEHIYTHVLRPASPPWPSFRNKALLYNTAAPDPDGGFSLDPDQADLLPAPPFYYYSYPREPKKSKAGSRSRSHHSSQLSSHLSKRDIQLLGTLDARRRVDRWLDMQADFFNATGRMVDADIIRRAVSGEN